MNKLRRWFHDQGFKHQRNMSLALASVERSAAYRREAGRMTDGVLALKQGWWALTDAIEMVVDCGCDRDMWPEQVQKAIPK